MSDDHGEKEQKKGSSGPPHECDCPEGAPEWCISFADNVAMLMAFFVILLALNMAKPTLGGIGGEDANPPPTSERMLDVIIALREQFNNPIDMHSSDPGEAALVRRMIERKGRSVQPGESGEDKNEQSRRETPYSNLGGTVPFDDDAPALNARASLIAEQIGKQLRGSRFMIEVRGYTSPAESRRDPQAAKRLSYERALAVAHALVRHGVRWEQIDLVAAGVGESRTGRTYDRDISRLDQRVEVVATDRPAFGDE